MTILSELNSLFHEALASLGYDSSLDKEMLVIRSNRPDLSQFQVDIAFALAKKLKRKPVDIAKDIISAVAKNNIFKDLRVLSGFINITLTDEWLKEKANQISTDKHCGISKTNIRNILIDYGGANIAKSLHVGHLRSAIIGEGLKRLARALGHHVIADVHLGDWGRQMGLVISEIKERNSDLLYFNDDYNGAYPDECPIMMEDLEEIYPEASKKAKENPAKMEDARLATSILQNKNKKGHRGYYELWKQIVKISVADLKKTYERFNVSFDTWKGESDANDVVPVLIDSFMNSNELAESDGALIMEIADLSTGAPLPPLILRTQNDSIGYHATELATIYLRDREYALDEIWYVVDCRQELHFRQVFSAAYSSGIISNSLQLKFVGFGTMNGVDGRPFRTRDGGLMKLNDLFVLVQSKMDAILREAHQNTYSNEEIAEVSRILADATIKYADATSSRLTNYIFDIEKFSSVNGKTGPYILYTIVRIKSVMKKAREMGLTADCQLGIPFNEYDSNVMLSLSLLPDVLDSAFNKLSLTELADYLYELSSLYNVFYKNCKILNNGDAEHKAVWLNLSNAVCKVSSFLLDILAIEIPDFM
jgi:arginyl-tRNA synthetase